MRNLWHDGSLLRWSTWRSGWALLMAPDGMFRGNVGRWRDYFAPDFHPGQQGAQRGEGWLRDNAASYTIVGRVD